MALFKILRGPSTKFEANLTADAVSPEFKDGYCYFLTGSNMFYVDYLDGSTQKRVPLNAENANTLSGAHFESDTLTSASGGGQQRIPSSATVYSRLLNKLNVINPTAQGTLTVSKKNNVSKIIVTDIEASNITTNSISIANDPATDNSAVSRKYLSDNIPRLFVDSCTSANSKTDFTFPAITKDATLDLNDPYYLVFYNGLLLSKELHYTITARNKITLNGWSANDTNDIVQVVGFVPPNPDTTNIW